MRTLPAGSGWQVLTRAQSAVSFPRRVEYRGFCDSFCHSSALTTEAPYSHSEQHTGFILARPGMSPLCQRLLCLGAVLYCQPNKSIEAEGILWAGLQQSASRSSFARADRLGKQLAPAPTFRSCRRIGCLALAALHDIQNLAFLQSNI